MSRASTANAWHTNNLLYTNSAQILMSLEHPNWRGQIDGGGPFLLVSTKYDIRPGYLYDDKCRGPFVTDATDSWPTGFSGVTQLTNSQMNAKGTTAIARSLPTNPAAQLSVALGELTNDGLPHVIGSSAFKNQVRTAHKAGDEYLNYEFGWLPLVSDLRKLAHAVKHRDEIMRGYMKYSDKQIRRRYDFPSVESQGAKQTSYNVDFNLDYYLRCFRRIHKKSDEWFSGAFRYHIPVPVGFADKAQYYQAEASKILGLELTPEVVWNLAPWSWAVDWFTNTGDVIHNISRLGRDGLVMRYGYQMRRDERSDEIIAQGAPGYPKVAGYNSYYRRTDAVKQRVQASPYGFGLTFNGLSNTQKAVVAALGLTRAF